MIQNELSDEALMALVAGVDEEAIEVLYDRYAAQIRGLALRMLRERRAADEIVQETYWRVWRHARSFEAGRGSFKSWLFTIAHRQAIDALRRQKIRLEIDAQPLNFEQISNSPPGSNEVQEAAWMKEQRDRVRAAVAELPPEQSQVIVLAFFNGLTRREIAEATGMPLGTVHSRARLALNKLREALKLVNIGET